jgi:hypothetical protein
MRHFLSGTYFVFYIGWMFCFFFFFFGDVGFELRTSRLLSRHSWLLEPLHHSTSPFFCDGFFQDRVSRTICLALNLYPPDLCLLSS